MDRYIENDRNDHTIPLGTVEQRICFMYVQIFDLGISLRPIEITSAAGAAAT